MIRSLAWLGLILGVRHAADADHVAAVSAMVTRPEHRRQALRLGAAWGLGHAATLLVVGGAIILMRLHVPAGLQRALEGVVGLVLVGLGLSNLLGLRARQVTMHSHDHGHDPSHAGHLHAHASSDSRHRHPHLHLPPLAAGWIERRLARLHAPAILRAALVGLIHGLAGSAGAALLVLAAIPEPSRAVAYLAVFACGTLAGMIALTTFMDLALGWLARWWGFGERLLRAAAGLLSFLIGVKLLLAVRAGGHF